MWAKDGPVPTIACSKDCTVKFVPKEDITTYELAECMSIMMLAVCCASQNKVNNAYTSAKDNVKRHFVPVE